MLAGLGPKPLHGVHGAPIGLEVDYLSIRTPDSSTRCQRDAVTDGSSRRRDEVMWSREGGECEEPPARGYCLLAYDGVVGNFVRDNNRNRIVSQLSNWIAFVSFWRDQLQGLRSLHAEFVMQCFQRSLQILAVLGQRQDCTIIPNQPTGLSWVREERHRFRRADKN